MNRIEKKRLVQFIFLTLLTTLIIQTTFNGINQLTTRSIIAEQGVLSGHDIDDRLYVIKGLEESDGSVVFTIETDQSLSVVVHNLTYPHDLLIDGVSVTTESDGYHCFQVSEGDTTVELSGIGVEHSFFFVSKTNTMKDYLELRTLINAFMLFLHLLVLIGCLIALYTGQFRRVSTILLIYVLSSMIKGINLGEFSVIENALGMSLASYHVIDGITTAINNILPIYVLLLLFDIHLKKPFLVLLGLLTIPFLVFSQNLLVQFQVGHMIVSIMVLSMTILILAYGYVKEKKAALAIMILRSVFLVFSTTYLTVIRSAPPISNLVFFFNYAYLGATIYFIGILGVVIAFYLRHNRDLAIKEKEYERVMLLKGLGHDLKHPVLTAKLNNQFLLEGDLKEAEKESVEITLKALGRLDKMIENINDYFNQPNKPSMSEATSLKSALKRIEASHKNQSDHLLVIRYSNEDCLININPINFNRIIDNLTDNAFKYNTADKTVIIAYDLSEEDVLITVEDRGIGLDQHEHQKVFDIFYRGEENRSIEGLGIGLSVVKQLVESAGGKIWVHSQKHVGTIFSMRFPINKS